MSLSLDIRQTGIVKVVDVSGRITLGDGASSLRETLREMVTAGNKNILLNLENVTYMDSSGLGVLVSGFASVTNAGGQLKLLNLGARIKDLLLITKLYTVFEVFDDEATAVRSYVPRPAEATTAG